MTRKPRALVIIALFASLSTLSCENQFAFSPLRGTASTTSSSCSYSTSSCPHTVSTWATRDTYVYAGGNTAQANAFASDTTNNLYTAGVSNDALANRWVVRQSTTAGATWAAAEFDDYQLAANQAAQANALRSDSAGNLYAVGTASDGVANHWIVRYYPAGAGPWSTVHDTQYAVNQAAQANGIAIDASDYLYVAGQASDGATTHWVVRKSVNAGTTWSYSDDFQYSVNQNASAAAIARNSSDGSLWSVGFGNDGTANRWIVRKSTNSGATWSTVDDFQYTGNQNARAYGVAFDSCGYIYVAGEAVDGSANTRWIVRKSADGGTSWSSIDDFVYTGGTSSSARSIAIESSGVLWVVGVGNDGASNFWVTRTAAAGGDTWSTSESYQNTGVLDSAAYGVGVDSSTGSVFVTGQGTSAGPIGNWDTRELGCL